MMTICGSSFLDLKCNVFSDKSTNSSLLISILRSDHNADMNYIPPQLGKSIWHMHTFYFAHAYNGTASTNNALNKSPFKPVSKVGL